MNDASKVEPLGSLSDGDLVERAQQGHVAAFESIFHRHQNRIYTLAYSILRNTADAKDVVQETFVKAYAKLGRLKRDGALLAYLCKTAINASVDVLRSRKAGSPLSLGSESGLIDTLAVPETYPEGNADLNLTRETVREAVLELNDDQRIVIVLHHIEGLQVEEISAMLRIPVGTVKSRLARARESLRRKLIGRLGIE